MMVCQPDPNNIPTNKHLSKVAQHVAPASCVTTVLFFVSQDTVLCFMHTDIGCGITFTTIIIAMCLFRKPFHVLVYSIARISAIHHYLSILSILPTNYNVAYLTPYPNYIQWNLQINVFYREVVLSLVWYNTKVSIWDFKSVSFII